MEGLQLGCRDESCWMKVKYTRGFQSLPQRVSDTQGTRILKIRAAYLHRPAASVSTPAPLQWTPPAKHQPSSSGCPGARPPRKPAARPLAPSSACRYLARRFMRRLYLCRFYVCTPASISAKCPDRLPSCPESPEPRFCNHLHRRLLENRVSPFFFAIARISLLLSLNCACALLRISSVPRLFDQIRSAHPSLLALHRHHHF